MPSALRSFYSLRGTRLQRAPCKGVMSKLVSTLILFTLLTSCVNRDCSKAICGCWEKDTYEYETTIIDDNNNPMNEVVLECADTNEQLGLTQQNGHVSIKFTTQVSPGCGINTCNTINLKKQGVIIGNINLRLSESHTGITVVTTHNKSNQAGTP